MYVHWCLSVVLMCISQVARDVGVLCPVLMDSLYIFSGEMSVQVLCLFFNCFVVIAIFYIFWILMFYQIYDLKIVSPVLWVVFFILLTVIFDAEFLIVGEPSLPVLSFIATFLSSYPGDHC